MRFRLLAPILSPLAMHLACGMAATPRVHPAPSGSAREAVTSAVDLTVHYSGPGPLNEASIILSGLLREEPLSARPDSTGSVVFRSVVPGRYRLEAHHPKGIATFKEVEIGDMKPAVEAIGLRSAFLYVPDQSLGPMRLYRDAMKVVFDRWRGGQRLAWVIDRPSSYATEVMVGVAGDRASGYVGFVLHAGARIADVKRRDEQAARGEAVDKYLLRLPALDQVEVRPSVRPMTPAVALGIVCSWKEAIRSALPQREVFPEVIDGNRYTFEVEDERGKTLIAETENLGHPMLNQTPRTRAMALFEDVHNFVDGHIGLIEFESHVEWATSPGCRPSKREQPASPAMKRTKPAWPS